MGLSCKRKFAIPALGMALVLTACNNEPAGSPASEAVPDQLEQAAAQSDPQAAKVLEQRADEARRMESPMPADRASGYVQDTMREAGNAAAAPTGVPE